MVAQNLKDTLKTVDPYPLKKGELEEYYINTFKSRGDKPLSKMEVLIRCSDDSSFKILFSGYKGSGKSTELNKLSEKLSEEFHVINFSVFAETDPITLTHIDLFVVITEKLLKLSEDLNVSEADVELESIYNWVTFDEIKESETDTTTKESEANFGGGFNLTFLQVFNFVANLKTKLISGGESKKELIKKIELKASEIISNCNSLIRAIELKLKEENPQSKGLLIIFEDLDKLDLTVAENLFYNYSSLITQINTDLILTFPFSLMYHTKLSTITGYFSNIFELPMIKVYNKDDSVNEEGRNTLKAILNKRFNVDALMEKGLVDKFIAKSGGCIRDLFKMIKNAALNAIVYAEEGETPIIRQNDYDSAYLTLKKEYERSIADSEDFKVEDYFKALKDTYYDENKKPANSEAVFHLRHNLCILSYNGEGWYDLHPLVEDIMREKGFLNELNARKGRS